jgi:hypothetical protein
MFFFTVLLILGFSTRIRVNLQNVTLFRANSREKVCCEFTNVHLFSRNSFSLPVWMENYAQIASHGLSQFCPTTFVLDKKIFFAKTAK